MCIASKPLLGTVQVVRREKCAAITARRWLLNRQHSPGDTERHLQRLLGIWAANVAAGRAKSDSDMHQLAAALPEFTLAGYTGDPLLPLALHTKLRECGIEHHSLSALAFEYAQALNVSTEPPEPGLMLVTHFLRRCGLAVRQPKKGGYAFTTAARVVTSGRKDILDLCRLVTGATACGVCRDNFENLAFVLAPLCVSYAKDWDLEVVCTLLRVCAYLGIGDSRACVWAREWMLDQQQAEGSFGLFAPEARRMGCRVDGRELYFLPTVRAVWALAELHQPGFMLS
jgi:hypothetical protein